MADAQLHFKIGSSFDGQGFSAVNKEIQNAGKYGKSLSGVMGNVIGEAQKLEGGLGKVAGAAGNVVSGFAQMGIIGGIVAGAKSAMDFFFDSAKENLDKMVAESKDRAERMRKALQMTVDRHVESVHKANEAIKTMSAESVKQFDETAQAAVRASQLIAQTDIARANNSIAKIQVEKLNAIIKEETDAGKALVAARYDFKIAYIKSLEAEERGAEQSDSARKAVDTARERLAVVHGHVIRAEYALEQARNTEASLAHDRTADTSKLAAEVKQAETALKEARKQERQAVIGVSEAEERLKATNLNVATEREQQKAAVLQARIALDKVNEAERKAAEAREKEAKAAEEAANKLAARTQAEKEYRDQVNAIELTGNGRIDAINGEIKKMREEIEKIEKGAERARLGVGTDARVKNGLFGAYQYRLDQNGNPDNFIDWQRAMRFADRAERDRKTREKRDAAYQKKMQGLQEKLEKRGEKALTDREKEALKRWNEYMDQKNGRQRREAEIKQKQLAIDNIRKQMAKDLQEAKEALKQALELR